MTPEQLFSDLLAADPARPFVTYYDEASGERSELSLKSLANWVAKTHFLLTDELGLGVGDTAFLALPAHWISVPALLGSLTAGLSLGAAAADAAVAFVSTSSVAAAAGVPDVYAIAPSSAATGFGGNPPAGAEDYVTSVRPQPDKWPTVHLTAGPSDLCLDGRSRAEVLAEARERASSLGVDAGARLLTTRDWSGPADLLDTLFVPLVVGGSVVYVRNAPDETTIERRMTQERATVRV
jgi:uncharacterized protein (TIGR03089 family)